MDEMTGRAFLEGLKELLEEKRRAPTQIEQDQMSVSALIQGLDDLEESRGD
jgi:hypothetical protein